MVLLNSSEIVPVDLPAISLLDVRTGASVFLHENSNILVLAVICNHCPYVLHIKSCMQEVLNAYANAKDIDVIAVSGNDPELYPEDSPDKMKIFSKDFNFPYLYDAEQAFLRAIGAVCTPEFYIYKKGKLHYHGRFDDSSPGNNNIVTGADLQNAITTIMGGKSVLRAFSSQGCSIKWKA